MERNRPDPRFPLWLVLVALVALVICTAATPAQQIILVSNVATQPQKGWTFVGLADGAVPKEAGFWYGQLSTPDGGAEELGGWFVPVPHGVRMQLDLPAKTTIKTQLNGGPDKPCMGPWFELHHAIATNPDATMPSWSCGAHKSDPVQFWPPGAPRPSKAFIRILETSAAHMLWHARTRIQGVDLTIDYWATVGSAQGTIEWTVQMVYGTTAGGPLSVKLPPVVMRCQHQLHVDFAKRVGILPPVQELPVPPPLPAVDSDVDVGTKKAKPKPEVDPEVAVPVPPPPPPAPWRVELSRDEQWWNRSARVEVIGATLCEKNAARLEGRPICGVWTEWDGKWLALGTVPQSWPNAVQETAQRFAVYMNPPAGGMYDQRQYCQPKESGTTGEQPDFGAAAGEWAVTMLAPWSIHDMRYHAQAFCMRPTGNKEPIGDPVLAKDHPRTVTTNLRPDDRFSDGDPLGWYVGEGTIPYSWPGTGYSSPDGQHRSDGVLNALIALTRDPALLQVAQDQLECQKMQLRGGEGRAGVPREIGRVMLANANALWLGLEDARPLIEASVGHTYRNASMFKIAQDEAHPIRVILADDEAKYGWNFPNGQPIRGWQGWQDTIFGIGAYAAWRVTNIKEARILAMEVSKTTTNWVYYQHAPSTGGLWLHTYAQRWRSEDPGAAHPLSSYTPMQPNYDIWTDGACDRWSTASLYMAQTLLPGTPTAVRAAEIIKAKGPPKNAFDARWWALPR